MIEVDDSQFDQEDREFVNQWAEALGVPVGVLVLRIFEAAVEGIQYVELRPKD